MNWKSRSPDSHPHWTQDTWKSEFLLCEGREHWDNLWLEVNMSKPKEILPLDEQSGGRVYLIS